MTGARPFSNSWHRPWGGKERASQTDSAIGGGLRQMPATPTAREPRRSGRPRGAKRKSLPEAQ